MYRRYQALLESMLTAIGLGTIVVLALNALSIYPDNWVLVIGVTIAIVGIRWPLLAYLVAVAVMVFPIYTINLYLAVLFLAISALGQRSFVHYMGATVLVLATPALAEYHLHWLVPILGGLWWGGALGAWVGGMAALWGKFLGGMAGLNLDWLVLAGHAPEAQAIIGRFYGANSLDTLLLLIEPFADTSNVILYNLLQVIGWMIAGGFVGSLAARKWVKYRSPWSILVVTAGGGLIMLATHLGLPYWLEEAVSEPARVVLRDPTGPLFSLLMVIIVGTTIYGLRESLDLPVAPRRNLRLRQRRGSLKKKRTSPAFGFWGRSTKSTRPDELNGPRRPVRIPDHNELPEWEPPQDDSGLIMLEID